LVRVLMIVIVVLVHLDGPFRAGCVTVLVR
jgi:hypothetical protein